MGLDTIKSIVMYSTSYMYRAGGVGTEPNSGNHMFWKPLDIIRCGYLFIYGVHSTCTMQVTCTEPTYIQSNNVLPLTLK